jgi:hypothetical protein
VDGLSVRPSDGQRDVVGVPFEFESVFVDESVVEPAQGDEVVDVMVALVFAVDHMVNFGAASCSVSSAA